MRKSFSLNFADGKGNFFVNDGAFFMQIKNVINKGYICSHNIKPLRTVIYQYS